MPGKIAHVTETKDISRDFTDYVTGSALNSRWMHDEISAFPATRNWFHDNDIRDLFILDSRKLVNGH